MEASHSGKYLATMKDLEERLASDINPLGQRLTSMITALAARVKVLEDKPAPLKGDKGETGAKGEKGEKGDTGEKADVTAEIQKLREDLDRLDKKPSFFTLYKSTPAPKDVSALFASVEELISEYGTDVGARRDDMDKFVAELKTEATRGAPPNNLTELQYAGARVWTSNVMLCDGQNRRQALFSVLAKASREDNHKLLLHGGIAIQKAINACIVNRGGALSCQAWPPVGWDHVSHRGAGIPQRELAFWRDLSPGQAYRVPAPLSTSIREHVAEAFLQDVVSDKRKVHFVFTWQSGSRPCMHARYIDNISACGGEEELLLCGYSALEYVSMDEGESASDTVKIYVNVFPDNKAVPEYLPLAYWH